MPGEEDERVGSSSGATLLTANQTTTTRTTTTTTGPSSTTTPSLTPTPSRQDDRDKPQTHFTKNHHHLPPAGPPARPLKSFDSPDPGPSLEPFESSSLWKDPPGLPTHPPPPIPPPSHHAEIEDDEDLVLDGRSSSDGSKLELELQFAGVDNENAELEEEEEGGSNYRVGEGGSVSVGGTGGVEGETEEPKPPEPPVVLEQTFAQKCLFYTTAFFILLAVFSLFSFLFLVPFVIDPALTTIFNEFDPEPALCFTESVVNLTGGNCTKAWTSCREGCTKEVYNCTQIWVRYRVGLGHQVPPDPGPGWSQSETHTSLNIKHKQAHHQSTKDNSNNNNNYYNYQLSSSRQGPGGGTDSADRNSYAHKKKKHKGTETRPLPVPPSPSGSVSSEGWVTSAHLYPNVKGCGYPPAVNCSVFLNKYATRGRNFSCFYSKVKPWLVVTSFNMDTVVIQLALSMAIPVPCFIISVIYLVFAYFRIYNTDSPSSATANPLTSSTNNNIQSPAHDLDGNQDPDPETSLSTMDEKTRILRRSTSRGLNAVSALTDKLMPNSAKGLHGQGMEMNDLTPIIINPPDGDLLLPCRNNRAPERNGPTNPAAKNKGGEPTLLGGFEETDF